MQLEEHISYKFVQDNGFMGLRPKVSSEWNDVYKRVDQITSHTFFRDKDSMKDSLTIKVINDEFDCVLFHGSDKRKLFNEYHAYVKQTNRSNILNEILYDGK